MRAEKSHIAASRSLKEMFSSRVDAGRQLGKRLQGLSLKNPVVLGITRGGVVVAAEVAKILEAPLYPLVVKKVSESFNPEFAVGAVGPEGAVVGEFSKEAADQVRQKMKKFGVKGLGKVVKNRTVIIVDDGIATGWTLRSAIAYAQGKQAEKIIAAVPVADREIAAKLRREVDELVVLEEVNELGAVGNFYEDFLPVSDEEVIATLKKAVDKFSQR